ncbi:helix-turn-helix domain-containing protein [Brevundimonas bacteroides]|uniref:helix-turn-helix domain-containing protein n=1 Tax=Brevundimonas bacteroides TaxID=74311 RepID=UPI0009FD98C5|nr:helix-turn-helix domain-containing protein [Brevundimonas bacteroides]
MPSPLTPRQEECLRLTAFKTDKEIAWALGISESVVKKHIFEACQRLGVNRRKAALALLERNVPSPPNDPMADLGPAMPRLGRKTEETDGEPDGGAATVDVGGTGARAPAPVAHICDGQGSGDLAPSGNGRPEAPVPGGSPARGSLSGLADGPGRRFGYRPPPAGLVRIVIIAALAFVMALSTKAVVDLVNDGQQTQQALDRARLAQ